MVSISFVRKIKRENRLVKSWLTVCFSSSGLSKTVSLRLSREGPVLEGHGAWESEGLPSSESGPAGSPWERLGSAPLHFLGKSSEDFLPLPPAFQLLHLLSLSCLASWTLGLWHFGPVN